MSAPKIAHKNIFKRKVQRCTSKKYNCSVAPMPLYTHCEKHILEDKNSPFRQCTYLYPSGEKCHSAIINIGSSQSQLCREHTEEIEANRLRPKCKILPPLPSADTILHSLSHYVKHSPYFKESKLVGATAEELLEQIEENKNIIVNPFTELDVTKINAKTSATLNYSCEADSDVEGATIDNVWDNAEQDSSDTESLDHEMTDPLRHAVVYTEEEMVLAMRNHAVRLQNLCIQQFRRLGIILREKRGKYLTELKREKEIYGPLTKPSQLTINEKKQYDVLKALAKYKKFGTGPEALLFKKMLDRRKAITPGLCVRSKNYAKCVFAEGGVKCALRVIPSTKYCKKHILNDRHQVLFKECGIKKKDHICKEPVIPIPAPTTCTYHFSQPIDNLCLPIGFDLTKNEKVAECESNDAKLHSSDIEQKSLLHKDFDVLLKEYTPKEESASYHNTPSTSTSESKNIADVIDMNITDKLLEGMDLHSINNALDDFSQSVDTSSQAPIVSSAGSSLEQCEINEEDLKSVVKEISNFLEMKDA